MEHFISLTRGEKGIDLLFFHSRDVVFLFTPYLSRRISSLFLFLEKFLYWDVVTYFANAFFFAFLFFSHQ